MPLLANRMEISDLLSARDLDDSEIEAICGELIDSRWKKLFFEQFAESLPSPEECASFLQSSSGKDVDSKDMMSPLNVTNVKFIEQNTSTALLA